MYEAFPKMRSLHFQSPTGPTECQDLLGMEFRTEHFNGMARVPAYSSWVRDCDMSGAYAFHRLVLQLLQWHCPPRFWHVKTPVHMLALDDLEGGLPGGQVPLDPPRPRRRAGLGLQPHRLHPELGQ